MNSVKGIYLIATCTVLLLGGCSNASEPASSITPTNSQTTSYQPMTKQVFLDQTSLEIEAIRRRESGWTLIHDSWNLSGLSDFTFNFTSEMSEQNQNVDNDLIGDFAVHIACQGPGSFELEFDATSVAQTLSKKDCGSNIDWFAMNLTNDRPTEKLITKIIGTDGSNQYRFIILYKNS